MSLVPYDIISMDVWLTVNTIDTTSTNTKSMQYLDKYSEDNLTSVLKTIDFVMHILLNDTTTEYILLS